MADLIQNVQDVYKKWESRSSLSFRGRRRDLQNNTNRRNNQYDNYTNYSRPGERKFKQRNRTPYFKLPKHDGLAQFKSAPCVSAENKPRPFMGSCCPKCFPMSRAFISDKRVFLLSICNALHFPYLHVLKLNPKHLYPDVSLNFMQSRRISQAVDETVGDVKERNNLDSKSDAILRDAQYDNARQIFASIKTSVSTVCLHVSGFFLKYILSRVFDGILMHKGQIEILETISREKVPIVYLPIYHGQLDFILISYIIYMNSLKVPLTVTDTHFYTPVLGYLTKFLGAIYIKQFVKNDNDKLDANVVHEYLTECLKAGHNLQFSLEGGQSRRSGKHRLIRSGLLSNVVDSVSDNGIEDIFISTVSISYEKVMVEDFVSEQLGQEKTKETFLSKTCSFLKMLHFNFGNVRLNFNQPFSLKEFLKTYKTKHPSVPLNTYTPPDSPSSSDEPGVQSCDNTHRKTVTNILAQHVIYDATASTALMSTQLVAFLLVTQYRKGATQQQLQNSLDWLRGELLNKKRDTGFTGDSQPVIKRALELLGKHLIMTETINMEWMSSSLENHNVKMTVYKPVLKLPYILEFQYYASSVVPVFLLDSMIANALYALVDVEICHFRHCDSRLYVLRDKLIDKAVELSDLLQFEFIAIPPCSDLVFSFGDALDELIEKDCLHVAGVGIVSGRASYAGKSHGLSFDASDDEESEDESPAKEQQLQIDLSEDSINYLQFLRNILSPYIESYWLAATTLLKLLDEIKEENIFIQDMQLTAKDKLYKGLLAYEESFSAKTFRNALKLFEHWHVVEGYLQDGIRVVYLNESYNNKERINDIISRIEQFRK